jgi:hypothetical protein
LMYGKALPFRASAFFFLHRGEAKPRLGEM